MTELRTVTLRGRVGTDIIVTTTPRGHVCARFRLAVGQWRVDDNGEFQETGTNWYTIKAWDTLAENVRSSVLKGQKIIVVGKPVAEAWLDRNQQARGELVIVAASIGHDLTAGPSRALMVQSPRGDSRAPGATHDGAGVREGAASHDGAAPTTHGAASQGARMTQGPTEGDQQWQSAPSSGNAAPDGYDQTPPINTAGAPAVLETGSIPNREYLTETLPPPPEEDYEDTADDEVLSETREPALTGAGAFAGAYDI